MKKNFIILLLLLPIIPLWFAACTDDKPEPKPEMPPLTFEGKNTFGCTINGELFTAPFAGNKAFAEYYYRQFEKDLYGTIVIENKDRNITRGVGMRLDTVVYDTGKYYLDTNAKVGAHGQVVLLKEKHETYYCQKDMYGWLHIQFLDTVRHIVSGTFEFDAVNEKNNLDTVKIREGRFDLKFLY